MGPDDEGVYPDRRHVAVGTGAPLAVLAHTGTTNSGCQSSPPTTARNDDDENDDDEDDGPTAMCQENISDGAGAGRFIVAGRLPIAGQNRGTCEWRYQLHFKYFNDHNTAGVLSDDGTWFPLSEAYL